jgi:hypothetical protein
MDSANAAGVTCFVWVQANPYPGVFSTIIDEATGAIVLGSYQVAASGNNPRVCVTGTSNNQFAIVWQGAGANILATVLSAAGGVVVGTTTIVTNGLNSSSATDLISMPGSPGKCILAYRTTRAATDVEAVVFDQTLTVTSDLNTAISNTYLTASIALAPFSDNTHIALVAVQTNTHIAGVLTTILSYSGGSLTVAQATSASSICSSGNLDSTGAVAAIQTPGAGSVTVVCFPKAPSGNIAACQTGVLSTANAVSGITTIANYAFTSGGLAGPYLAGKPFASNSAIYIPVAIQSPLQSCLFVLDASGNVVANALYGTAGYGAYSNLTHGVPSSNGGLPTCPSIGTNSNSLMVPQQGLLSFSSGTNTTAINMARVVLTHGRPTASPTPLWHAQAANCLYFSGSYLAMYDGLSTAEAGFFYFPEGVAATGHNPSGGSISGTFQVCALYEWIDGKGQRHQSAPSPAVSVTLSLDTGIDMKAPMLLLGARASNATVVFYRTKASGKTFYRVNPPTAAIANSNSSYQATYTNTISSPDTIDGNEVLYTTGGALPNDNPVACNAIASHQGRIAFSSAEDNSLWLYSQAPTQGQGLYFNETLTGARIPQDSGQISALFQLDDKLVVSTPTRKHVVFGTGPASTGLNGTYTQPQLLPSDVGCIDQRSQVLLPDVTAQDSPLQLSRQGGIAYQSKHGLYLLNRGLTDEYIGLAAEAYTVGTTLGPAVLLTNKPQVRWTISGASDGACVLVYDYLWGQWSTFKSTGMTANSACVWGGYWTTSGTGNQLFQETPGVYVDPASQYITVSLTTAWLKVSSLQGFQRLRRALFFGTYGGPSTLTLKAYQDYTTQQRGGIVSPILGVTTPSIVAISEATAGLTTSDGLRWQLRWHQQVQKCESVQFALTDTPTGGNYSGIGFSGMTLEFGVKKGPYKLPSAVST